MGNATIVPQHRSHALAARIAGHTGEPARSTGVHQKLDSIRRVRVHGGVHHDRGGGAAFRALNGGLQEFLNSSNEPRQEQHHHGRHSQFRPRILEAEKAGVTTLAAIGFQHASGEEPVAKAPAERWAGLAPPTGWARVAHSIRQVDAAAPGGFQRKLRILPRATVYGGSLLQQSYKRTTMIS